MKYLILRNRSQFAEVEAKSKEAAMLIARMGLIPESEWRDDDRPDTYAFKKEVQEEKLCPENLEYTLRIWSPVSGGVPARSWRK